MSLLHKYRKEKLLEKRLSRLERVIVERSIGKNSEPSKAYRIWDYLMNNGPTSVADLKRVLPDDITRAINFFAKNDLLVKNGDIVSANADYAWDDVGVIPRTAEQEVLNDIGNKLNSANTADSSDSPTPTRRRAVKANLFSRKIEEVKAAIDAGQDVNQINDKGQTPLLYACGTKTDTDPIVELLRENGADPTITINGDRNQCISLAIKNKNISVIKALALGGVALYNIYKNTDCYLCALIDYLDEATFSKVLDKHFSSSTRLYMYILHSIITAAFRKYGTIVVAKILNICFSNVGKGYDLDQFIPNLPNIGDYIIPDELCEEILNICIKNGCVPNCVGVRNDYNLWNKNRYISQMLFDTVKGVGSGKLKLYDGSSEYFNIIDFISSKYGWAIDNVTDILTQSVIDRQSARWGWGYILRAKESDKIKLLRKFKFKRLKQQVQDIGMYILPLLKDTNKELTRALFKQTRSYIISFIDYYLSNGLVSNITGIKNKYFFECLLDLDDSEYIGNKLAHFCSRSAYSTNAQVCIDALAEAGYDLNKADIDYSKIKNNDSLINDIIDHINDDTMSTNTRRTIEADPSILANSRIQDALNKADDDNTTARQIRTMYDRWVATAEKDKYDM